MNIQNLTGISSQTTTDTETKVKKEQEALLDACRQFEAIFINLMLQQMRATIPGDGLTEKSQAREIYEAMHDEAMAEEMSQGQGIGLAQQMYRQLAAYHLRP